MSITLVDIWLFPHLLLHFQSVVCACRNIWRNSVLRQTCSWKSKRRTLLAFVDQCKYSFFDGTQNSASSSFLRLCVCEKSGNHFIELSLVSYITIHYLILHFDYCSHEVRSPSSSGSIFFHHLACWVDSFTIAWFCNSGKYWLYLFKCSHIWSFNIKKSHLFVSATKPIRKVFIC